MPVVNPDFSIIPVLAQLMQHRSPIGQAAQGVGDVVGAWGQKQQQDKQNQNQFLQHLLTSGTIRPQAGQPAPTVQDYLTSSITGKVSPSILGSNYASNSSTRGADAAARLFLQFAPRGTVMEPDMAEATGLPAGFTAPGPKTSTAGQPKPPDEVKKQHEAAKQANDQMSQLLLSDPNMLDPEKYAAKRTELFNSALDSINNPKAPKEKKPTKTITPEALKSAKAAFSRDGKKAAEHAAKLWFNGDVEAATKLLSEK